MEGDRIKLTEFSRFAGCGAKLGPGLLDKALCNLAQPAYPNLLSDFSHAEDCGVYRLAEDLALVQTIDFFPPVCDDPVIFGRVAAANALSDVYAMGATPITAVSVVCFPEEKLEITYLRQIMEGALEKLVESRTALVGGHSVRDAEVKFGLCVNGTVHPAKIWSNNTWRPGEVLILTKPIGVGLVNTASRAGVASTEEELFALDLMQRLNKDAAEVFHAYPISACTDVTGFGLLGHLCEMATDNAVGAVIETAAVPIIGNARSYATMGLIPAGAYTNIEYRARFVAGVDHLDEDLRFCLFDPQTSGGLLASIAEEKADDALMALRERGIEAAVIGYTTTTKAGISVV